VIVVLQPRIFILHIKQLLPSIDLELGNNRNATEHIPMRRKLMSEDVFQDEPILESLVDCFLSVPDVRLHSFTVNVIANALWTLDKAWSLSNVTIISLHSFIFTEVALDGVTKYRNIIPHTALVWPTDPNAITSKNAQPHFISKTRFLELMAVECGAMLRYSKVSAINRQEAIIAFVSFQSIFKYDLIIAKKYKQTLFR
jgi:hypothetical protein